MSVFKQLYLCLQKNIFQALKVAMTKHPTCFKLVGDLKTMNEEVVDKPVVLYDGNDFN